MPMLKNYCDVEDKFVDRKIATIKGDFYSFSACTKCLKSFKLKMKKRQKHKK